MADQILFYVSLYLIVGIVSSWIINQVIIKTNSSEPYTGQEIFLTVVLWPVNVSIFLYSLIRSLLQ